MNPKDWEAGPRIDGHNYSQHEDGMPVKISAMRS